MSEVLFYHLDRQPLERVLPGLLEKCLERGWRTVVQFGSEERMDAIDAHLWTYRDDAFLAHGAAGAGNRDGSDFARLQPIWLTTEDENPNGARFLFLTDGAVSEKVGEFERVFELFDGRNDDAVAAARGRWKDYKDAGHTLAYWRQTDAGGWEKAG